MGKYYVYLFGCIHRYHMQIYSMFFSTTVILGDNYYSYSATKMLASSQIKVLYYLNNLILYSEVIHFLVGDAKK